MSNENDHDLNFKSFKNKNEKSLFLIFQISKFNKLNRDDKLKRRTFIKITKVNKKSKFKTKYKNKIIIYINIVATKNDSASPPSSK